ncbi:Uncharacterized protein YwbO [Grifola frondosa]|uniref:Uncharacterized protein YwbO n=1 Tax=Grifola frondosa TaxID=5627 RepID=A0A1C7M6W5_GRIFR|nr:Uncharacterized protein YwbO [Grifola frondosa]
MHPRVITLVVISDIICPWCYIGQRELTRAIESVQDLDVVIKIEHRPYKLQPSLGEDETLDKNEWYVGRFGEEKLATIREIVTSRAKQVGLDIKFEGTISQTTKAHRLSLKAWKLGGQHLQEALLDAIFKAYFEDGKNIGNCAVLSDLAEVAGVMSKDEAITFLKSDECLDEVEQMMIDARKKGVKGVPFTVINGKWAVSGGQTAEVYAQIFRKLAQPEKMMPLTGVMSGPTSGLLHVSLFELKLPGTTDVSPHNVLHDLHDFDMHVLPFQHRHWFYVWIPILGAFMWFSTLWAMLITWLASGRPKYVSQDGSIAYISDIGADILKPLFIVGCAITGVSFFLSLSIERWLRHSGRCCYVAESWTLHERRLLGVPKMDVVHRR